MAPKNHARSHPPNPNLAIRQLLAVMQNADYLDTLKSRIDELVALAEFDGPAGGRPSCAPHTADRDKPSGGIISGPTPGSAPPLVPLRSEHERRSYHRPAICHRHRPLTPCHGPTAAHARGAPSQLPAPRRASHGVPMTRAPAGPRSRRVA